MRIERIIKGVKNLGPGNRLAIWTNGCNKRCQGCVSKNLQIIDERTNTDIIATLNEYRLDNVDGVTISGGEPFIQAKELKAVIEFLLEKNINDILIYSGYTYEELLDAKDDNINYILDNIAVLIDGEYIDYLNDNTSNIKGSTNQKMHIFNKEYEKKYIDYIKVERELEVFYVANLKIGVGIPTKKQIEEF